MPYPYPKVPMLTAPAVNGAWESVHVLERKVNSAYDDRGWGRQKGQIKRAKLVAVPCWIVAIFVSITGLGRTGRRCTLERMSPPTSMPGFSPSVTMWPLALALLWTRRVSRGMCKNCAKTGCEDGVFMAQDQGMTRWWNFKYFWNFHPETWGNDPILTCAYFSNGLVQPPTSFWTSLWIKNHEKQGIVCLVMGHQSFLILASSSPLHVALSFQCRRTMLSHDMFCFCILSGLKMIQQMRYRMTYHIKIYQNHITVYSGECCSVSIVISSGCRGISRASVTGLQPASMEARSFAWRLIRCLVWQGGNDVNAGGLNRYRFQ